LKYIPSSMAVGWVGGFKGSPQNLGESAKVDQTKGDAKWQRI
jgi:hypothetical protein